MITLTLIILSFGSGFGVGCILFFKLLVQNEKHNYSNVVSGKDAERFYQKMKESEAYAQTDEGKQKAKELQEKYKKIIKLHLNNS